MQQAHLELERKAPTEWSLPQWSGRMARASSKMAVFQDEKMVLVCVELLEQMQKALYGKQMVRKVEIMMMLRMISHEISSPLLQQVNRGNL